MQFLYESEHLYIKILTPDYAPSVLTFLYRNREYFEQYETSKPAKYYTVKYQRDNLRAEFTSFIKQRYIRFYVFEKGNDNDIIGTISFSNFLQYPYSNAYIGYKFDQNHLHMGYATEAVCCAVNAVFHDLKLHRLEAYVMPANLSSIRLLERIGFENEGICRQFICVCGKYEDHIRYALINSPK